MDGAEYRVSRYDGAALLLTKELRDLARQLPRQEREMAEEIRLRAGRRPVVLLPEGEKELGSAEMTRKDLDGVLEIATQASAYSARGSISAGYITVRGGYRIGVCGTAVVQDGGVRGIRSVSSLAIRIAREFQGIAGGVMEHVMQGGSFRSALIVSPPGCGKTTLLRDMIRLLSDGGGAVRSEGYRVSLADERGEVAALWEGSPQMDVGCRTDILDACPKAEAVMMLLRSMNPQIIALDEITAPADVTAVETASNCGVRLLATAHADDLGDLKTRPLYRKLLDTGVFETAVTIRKSGAGRIYRVERLVNPL